MSGHFWTICWPGKFIAKEFRLAIACSNAFWRHFYKLPLVIIDVTILDCRNLSKKFEYLNPSLKHYLKKSYETVNHLIQYEPIIIILKIKIVHSKNKKFEITKFKYLINTFQFIRLPRIFKAAWSWKWEAQIYGSYV